MLATQFRMKAIEYQQRVDNDRDYFFTSSFTANEEARQEIRERFQEFLAWVEKRVEGCEASEVYQLNCDLFRY